MNIRSITVGINWENREKAEILNSIQTFNARAADLFSSGGSKIRTFRLTIPPINRMENFSQAAASSVVASLSSLCATANMRWMCVPIDGAFQDSSLKLSDLTTLLIRQNKNIFVNYIISDGQAIYVDAIPEASKSIRNVAKLSRNGFDNFRLGVSAGCRTNTPFFPFSSHNSDKSSGFSIALEIFDLFFKIIDDSKRQKQGLTSLQDRLVSALSESLVDIAKIAEQLEAEMEIEFMGIDASLAPFPDGNASVARLIEMLSGAPFGSPGTTFYTMFLTDILKTSLLNSRIKKVGFNGVMYSLLEDDVLALRNKEKRFDIDSLMLYSTVCGCGLDMLPIPGDVIEEELCGLIYDVAALSIAHSKPLGVRVLPIPGLSENDPTDFNYDFLVDTRVMKLKQTGLDHVVIDEGQYSLLTSRGRYDN